MPGAFGLDVDYAQLVKIYGEDPSSEHRYSPPICLGAEPHRVIGFPDPNHISTSYVERSNLTLRTFNRRFTRLTCAFSKKLENHCHMIALYTVWYNFVKMHKTVRMSPALAAGVADRLWTIEDIVAITDEREAQIPRKKVGRKPKVA